MGASLREGSEVRSVCGTHQSGGNAREPAGEMGLEVKTKAGLEM